MHGKNIKNQKLQHFQTDGETWEKRAEKGKLPAVIDPGDLKGRKNLYIDTIHREALQKALGKSKKERIVDFGCGSGRFSDLLSYRCKFLVGFEITQEMLDVAKNECRNSNTGFVMYDGLNLPMKEQKVDAFVSVTVLQYITDDGELEKVLKEITRCLKPGGELICIEQVTKNQRRWQRDLRTYLSLFERSGLKEIADYPVRKGHFLWLYPIYLGFVPKSLFKATAKLEMLIRRVLWRPVWDYQEYLFRMKKE